MTCTCGCTAAVAAADAGIGLAGNEAEGNPGDSGIAGSKPEEIKSQRMLIVCGQRVYLSQASSRNRQSDRSNLIGEQWQWDQRNNTKEKHTVRTLKGKNANQ